MTFSGLWPFLLLWKSRYLFPVYINKEPPYIGNVHYTVSMLKSDILRLFFSYAAQDPHSKSRFVNSWFFHSPILFFVYEFEGKKKRKKIILSRLSLLLAYLVYPVSRVPSINRFIRFSLQTKTEELWISFHNSVFKFFCFLYFRSDLIQL